VPGIRVRLSTARSDAVVGVAVEPLVASAAVRRDVAGEHRIDA
jgi:hypothetical protein